MNFKHLNSEEKDALDKIIKKSRVHFYKPIQIAEILYRHRIFKDIDLKNLESYRNSSKKWRDEVCYKLVGRVSTSSQKFQDNLFERNAITPELLEKLGKINSQNNGCVEQYIYQKFKEKFNQINFALNYCTNSDAETFCLEYFLNIFQKEAGLKRSIDKIYEIVVYALFSSLIEALEIDISIKVKDLNNPLFKEFADFSEKILGITHTTEHSNYPAKLFRVGVTNAADRGLDMWGNFGLAIQIKHLSLTKEIAHDVSQSIDADRIIIVCKDAEEKIIASLLKQIGWQARIQAIITLTELKLWYKKALNETNRKKLGEKIIKTLTEQIKLEFPSSENNHISTFFNYRNY